MKQEKILKIKDLKKWVNKLTEEELEQNLLYSSEYTSGVVLRVGKAKKNLYYLGDDDPSELYSREQLLEDGWHSLKEIKEMTPEIPKGAFVLEF